MGGQAKAIVLSTKDNVATAIADLDAGASVALDVHGRSRVITLASSVPLGHKFALKDLSKGEAVIKYGEPIGQAAEDILEGAHVHVHNVASRPRGVL